MVIDLKITEVNKETKKSKKDYELKEKQQDLEFKKQIEQAKRQAYYDAYIQDLKNRGYTIKYKKTFKDYIRYFITIIVIFFTSKRVRNQTLVK